MTMLLVHLTLLVLIMIPAPFYMIFFFMCRPLLFPLFFFGLMIIIPGMGGYPFWNGFL